MSETSACPLNDFFDIDEENDLDELKKEDTQIYNGNFLTYIYKQLECCCLSFFDELEKKNKRKNITLKKNYLEDYNKNKKNIYEFSVFDKILKKNGDLITKVPLDSKYFNPHADWCECAHELEVELNSEEVEFCIFHFFLKMYRSESRDKDLLLSIILECLYSKKDFKKEYYGQRGDFKFLKEIKNIETSNFKESLNELVNIIENTNFTECNRNKEIKNNGNKKSNEKFYFKLYVIIKIRYSYGIYIFNCDDTYDIVVIDCNTFNKNKPKIMSFFSIRKFISFLNNVYSINFSDEHTYGSFPIIVYESRECYASSYNHLPLKSSVCKKKKKIKKKNVLDEKSKESEEDEDEDEGDDEDDDEDDEEDKDEKRNDKENEKEGIKNEKKAMI
ncbi:conserved Plasmodium protein, unknown function [Plasmodium relictum]|uniref:Uncharacterized protein n=1 Tax=Plasmodium relictum TaxID=85471 RepID=A0A1J1HC53_PLARL|nr:conserved Plasmodium protein, unknown function [Plasmodium relictum]CRH02536.1 conserved Plasmodium protein, unknown function [Plasmodium relictum]